MSVAAIGTLREPARPSRQAISPHWLYRAANLRLHPRLKHSAPKAISAEIRMVAHDEGKPATKYPRKFGVHMLVHPA